MKLFASDFDGTLSKNHIGISKKNRTTIKKWQEQGHLFGFVSGRDYYNLREVAKQEHLDIDFYVCFNGAYVVSKEGKLIHVQRITEDLEGLMKLLKKKTITALAVSDHHYYLHHFLTFNKLKNQIGLYGYIKMNQLFHKRIKTKKISSFKDDPIIQISCLTKSNEHAMRLAILIESMFKHVNAMVNQCYVDIIAVNSDKATGMRAILNHYDVSFEDVYVAGDNYNDVEMIEQFQSFVMSDGVKEVQDKANYVVDDVSDALIQLLEEEHGH